MSKKSWQEVSLIVDGERAEAVAEVLGRYIPEGVVIESTAVRAGSADENGEAIGPLRVCGYIPADENLEITRSKIEQGLWYLGRISPMPEPVFQLIEEQNWMEAWKQHYHPIPVGKRLLILPAWIDAPMGERIPLRIEPGMAFGTGTHPTTQLCLELAEQYFSMKERRGEIRVIDIGCGTGILAIGAILLGATAALGVDIDPEAMKASKENAALNGVSDQLELGVGSVAEVIAGKFGLRRGKLVFANILAPVLVQLLDDGLGELLINNGCLILSGILEEQSHMVEEALDKHNFQHVQKRQLGDWVALAAWR